MYPQLRNATTKIGNNLYFVLLTHLTLSGLLMLSSCRADKKDFSFLDKITGNGEGIGRCLVSQEAPIKNSTVKIPDDPSLSAAFSIQTSGTNCEVKYYLNSNPIPVATGPTANINSSQLDSGPNILRAEVQGLIGSETVMWYLVKNQKPSCALHTPSLPNINETSAPGDISLRVNGSTSETGETLFFRWLVNNEERPDLIQDCLTNSTSSQCNFKKTGLANGLYAIKIEVSDGIDKDVCEYNVNIGSNCMITAKNPNVTSQKWSHDSSAPHTLSVTTSDPNCLVNWSINDIPVVGSGSSRLFYASEPQLLVGSNIVKAKISDDNWVQWVIVKNSPPSCSPTPAPVPNPSISEGGSLTLSGIFSDSNADSLTWRWYLGSTPVHSGSGNSGSWTFHPTSSHIGTQQVKVEVDDGYDQRSCEWNVQVTPACSITSSLPLGSDIFVSAFATAQTSFSVEASSGCSVSWDVDGISYGSGALKLLSSSVFSATGTTHNVTATVSNSGSSVTRTWQVRRNLLPTCASYSPESSGYVIAVGAPQTFQLTISDTDSSLQTYDYQWTHNGNTPPFSPTSGGFTTQATWTPNPIHEGVNNLAVQVKNFYRGSEYDVVTCMWNTMVLPPCSLASSTFTPSSSSLKVPFQATHETNFSAIANHSSCSITWELNTTTVGGGNNHTIISSQLNPYPNTNILKAKLINAVSSVEQTWSITKNAVASCSTQSPGGPQSINLGDSTAFSGSFSNPDSDSLSYQWFWAGNPITGATSNSFTFTPNVSHLGTNQLLRLKAFDSYDESYCDWTVTVSDPNVAQILSAIPTSSPTNPVVILSTGSQTFSVTASGASLSYKWYLDNVLIAGRTGSSETFNYADIAPGAIRELKVIVESNNGSTITTDEHIFYVKRNRKPVIDSFLPSLTGITHYRVNIENNVNASVTASDADGDSLSYTWTLDNMTQDNHPAGILTHSSTPSLATSAVFSPSNNTLYLGTHQLRVIVSDGFESATQLWLVSVNYFSQACNTLYNSPTSTAGGKICTLVGNPSIGHEEDVITDRNRHKISPNYVLELEQGVYAYADGLYHIIGIVNNSGSTKTYFGQSIANKEMKVVLGVGQRGRNSDASTYTMVKTTNASGESYFNFKLYDPSHLAWDASAGILYVADRGNNRVLALVNSGAQAGRIVRVLGLANGFTTFTTNHQGNGHTTSCHAPSSLAINSEGSEKYLYVTCNGVNSHQIKKVKITGFDGSSSLPNFDTVIAVGRLVGTSSSSGQEDGLGGATAGASNGSVARTSYPFGLFAHGGLIYFSDYTKRIRVYNPTASTVDIYPQFSAQVDKFSSSNLIIYSGFLSSHGSATLNIGYTPTSGANMLNTTVASSGTPTSYTLVLPSEKISSACHLVILRTNGNVKVSSGTNVTVTANSSVLHNTPDCSDTASNALNLTISAGNTHVPLWVKTAANFSFTAPSSVAWGTPSSTVIDSNFMTSGTFQSVPTSHNATNFDNGECIPLQVSIRRTSSSAGVVSIVSGSPIYTSIYHNNIGTFYADKACSTLLQDNRIAFENVGPAVKTVFYKRDVKVAPGAVASILGINNTASSTHITSLGSAAYSGYGYWLAPITDSSNNLIAIAYNLTANSLTGLAHTVNAVNLTGSPISIGKTIAPYSTANLVNTNNTPGFVNDDIVATYNGNFNTVKGVSVVSLGTDKYLAVADFNNKRIRFVELFGTSGMVRAALGIGRTRERINDMTAEAYKANLAYPYKLNVYNNKLYFSEYYNHRVRFVDLNTGIVSTAVGAGWGTSFSDGIDATTEYMSGPRGFEIVPWPNHASPTHYVLVYAQNRHVRAVNLSSTPLSNFFGVYLLPNKVYTIAGDNAQNNDPLVSPWAGASPLNTNGMNARFARFRWIWDISVINNNLYILDYLDNCIARVTSDGKLYKAHNGCGTSATTASGEFVDFTLSTPNSSSLATTRPTAFARDAAFLSNYFLLTDYESASSKLVYLNSSNSDVSFYGFTGTQTVSATGYLINALSIYDIAAPTGLGQARAQGLATWSHTTGTVTAQDKICWSTGEYDQGSSASWPGSTNGTHSIYCTGRTGGSPQIIGGQALGPGGPLGLDQENITATAASFFGPTGLAFDDEGNLYIADAGNHIIRMIRRWW